METITQLQRHGTIKKVVIPADLSNFFLFQFESMNSLGITSTSPRASSCSLLPVCHWRVSCPICPLRPTGVTLVTWLIPRTVHRVVSLAGTGQFKKPPVQMRLKATIAKLLHPSNCSVLWFACKSNLQKMRQKEMSTQFPHLSAIPLPKLHDLGKPRTFFMATWIVRTG